MFCPMRTHGWGGDPPKTDEEAVDRIIEAAIECVLRYGTNVNLAKVASQLHVTRQTVYRYFPGTSALFQAVSARVADRLVAQVAETLQDFDDPVDKVIQVVFFCIRNLTEDPAISFIVDTGRGSPLITARGTPLMAEWVLASFPIDLEHLYPEELSILAEHMVRLLQALVLDPDTPERDDADLRHFLRACLEPNVHPVRMPR
jgi:AcrR family transcriptional regulator